MTEPTETDLVIVGGGPAGLSAAITFARTLRPFILYDSEVYRNGNAIESHTIPGYDGVDPAAFRAQCRRDLDRYTSADACDVRLARVVSARRVLGGSSDDPSETMFEITDQHGHVVRARKVVLATGVRDVLPDIPGLAALWGNRAIHCLFCHGTETANTSIGFFISPSTASAIVTAILTMWAKVPHKKRYMFTNGVGVDTEQDRQKCGMSKDYDVLIARGFEIITDAIASVSKTPSGDMVVSFSSRPDLEINYLMLAPEQVEPSADARALLTPALLGLSDLGPGGALPGPRADAGPAHMPPRAGADPRTPIRGLFWAGNAGSPYANVVMVTTQGALAAVVATDELGNEDLERERQQVKKR